MKSSRLKFNSEVVIVSCRAMPTAKSRKPTCERSLKHWLRPKACGRWAYRNPAGMIARAIGAPQAITALATVGVLQQTLIGEACSRIAQGQAHTTLITGADAGYRLLRAQIAGQHASERDPAIDDTAEPHITMAPKDELRHPVEKRAGLQMPVGLYATMESALRAQRGWSVDTGEASVAGYTVLHSRGQAPRGVALVDTPQRQRALTTTEDAGLVARLQQKEFVGRRVRVDQNRLMA